MNFKELTIEQIKEQYPNEWILVGNPVLSGTSITKGIVIFHCKDKREIASNQIDWRAHYQSAMTLFTGERAKSRKFCIL